MSLIKVHLYVYFCVQFISSIRKFKDKKYMYSAYRVCTHTCTFINVILCRIRDKVTELQKYNNAKLAGVL